MHSRLVLDLVVFVILVGMSFLGIVSADVTWAYASVFWSALAVVFALGTLLLSWVHRRAGFKLVPTTIKIAAHWFGVLVTVHAIFYFVSNNQITEAEAGLALSIVFALATYLCGVAIEWRLIPMGAAVAIASMAAALVQENLWILLGAALIALAVILALDWLRYGRAKSRTGDAGAA